jgi:DegV family protein with EDD domain
MPIAIATDSTADLPTELLEKYHIRSVPAILIVDGQGLADGPDISRREFYERMPTMRVPPTTSAPSAGAFMKIYEQAFQQGADRIISLHAASQLSGIFNAARLAAKSFGERVQVVDSGQITLGLGFQVLAACEAAADGADIETILARVASVRQRVKVIAMLDTLEYLRRSGRVSWARASLGSLLSIKPFIELREGVTYRMGEVRTRFKGIQRLVEIVHGLGPLERLGVLHTNAEQEARQILSLLAAQTAREPMLVNVTTIIGTHVGPNGLGFAAVTQ